MVSQSANSFLLCSKRHAGRILIALGLLLAALNTVHTFEAEALVDRHINPVMAGGLGADGQLANARAKLLADYLTPEKRGDLNLLDATHVVHQATIHSDDRRIGITENWLQWLLGKFYSPLGHVQLTERLVHGRLANCSERAQILKSVVEEAGLTCRFVGLSGHVVLEVCHDGHWSVADPGYDVVYDLDISHLQQSEAEPLVRERLRAAGYASETIDSYMRILQSTENNTVMPVGSPISPRLYGAEVACNWLVWLIPLGSILAGLNVHRFGRHSIR